MYACYEQWQLAGGWQLVIPVLGLKKKKKKFNPQLKKKRDKIIVAHIS